MFYKKRCFFQLPVRRHKKKTFFIGLYCIWLCEKKIYLQRSQNTRGWNWTFFLVESCSKKNKKRFRCIFDAKCWNWAVGSEDVTIQWRVWTEPGRKSRFIFIYHLSSTCLSKFNWPPGCFFITLSSHWTWRGSLTFGNETSGNFCRKGRTDQCE